MNKVQGYKASGIWQDSSLCELAKRLSAEPGAERLIWTGLENKDESREKETESAGKGTDL